MNILSKQFLIQTAHTPVEAYEAYYINNGVMTLLGDVTDLSKTFAAQDEFIYTNLFVYEGDIYQNGTKLTNDGFWKFLTGRTTSSSYYAYRISSGGSLSLFGNAVAIQQITGHTWLKVCGYASTSSSGTYRAFAEAADGLFYVKKTETQISTLTNWTKICGYGDTSSANYYGYGINDGKLYYLYANGNGAVQQGADTTWTDITGSREGTSWCGFGINAGKLYKLSGTPTQIGTDTTWTKITGTGKNNGTAFSLGLNAGKLYMVSNTTATQVGNSADWKNCSGFCMVNDETALAYDSTALYGIAGDGTVTKLMDGDWVYVGGNYSTAAYGVAIRRVYR